MCFGQVTAQLVRKRDSDPMEAGIWTQTKHTETRFHKGVVVACMSLENRGFSDDVKVILSFKSSIC
jgi:transposase